MTGTRVFDNPSSSLTEILRQSDRIKVDESYKNLGTEDTRYKWSQLYSEQVNRKAVIRRCGKCARICDVMGR